jgi:hypothetical protein
MTAVSDELIPRNPCAIKGAGIEHADERPMLDISLCSILRMPSFHGFAPMFSLQDSARSDLASFWPAAPRHRLVARHRARQSRGAGDHWAGTHFDSPEVRSGRSLRGAATPTQAELSHHMDAYVAPEPDAYVFTRPSGRPLRRSDLSNAWHAACAVVGIDGVHPHDLRHFAGTTTARMPGITTKELMSRMGHASPRAALIYQHATQERDRVVADYLGERSSIEVASPTEI